MSRTLKALRVLPWTLLPAGALLAGPFLFGLLGDRALAKASWLLAVMLLVLPFAALPIAAVWAAFGDAPKNAPVRVLQVGFLRYAPVVAGLFALIFLFGKDGPNPAQAVLLGALIILYARLLLKHDAS